MNNDSIEIVAIIAKLLIGLGLAANGVLVNKEQISILSESLVDVIKLGFTLEDDDVGHLNNSESYLKIASTNIDSQLRSMVKQKFSGRATDDDIAEVHSLLRGTLELAFPEIVQINKDELTTELIAAKLRAYGVSDALSSDLQQEVYNDMCQNFVYLIWQSHNEMPIEGHISDLHVATQKLSSKIEIIAADLQKIKEKTYQDEKLSDADYTLNYRLKLADKQNYLNVVGLDDIKNRSRAKYKLNTAYISLRARFHKEVHDDDVLLKLRALQRRGQFDELQKFMRDTEGLTRIEKCLEQSERILLRGEAGSGKSTLLRWICVNSANADFEKGLEKWNRYTPFLIRLRDFSDKPLPTVEAIDYIVPVGLDKPTGWIQRKLANGTAMILIDGVDEVAEGRREEVQRWINDLESDYKQAPIIVTSRPEAIEDDWLDDAIFTDATLLPMTMTDIRAFVKHWHNTILSLYNDNPEECEKVQASHDRLIGFLEDRENLRQLAQNPLLCAALCMLNRDREEMPTNRLELYESFIRMLLHGRDKELENSSKYQALLDYEQKRLFLGEIAAYMLFEADAKEPMFVCKREHAENLIQKIIDSRHAYSNIKANEALDYLLERSGLLRLSSPTTIDFSHRTIGEYLAAQEYIKNQYFNRLTEQVDNDLWFESIRFAVTYANKHYPTQIQALMDGLIVKAEQGSRSSKLLLLSLTENRNLVLTSEQQESLKEFIPQILPIETRQEAIILGFNSNWATPHLKYNAEYSSQQNAYMIEVLAQSSETQRMNIFDTFKNYEATDIYSQNEPVIYALFKSINQIPEEKQYIQNLIRSSSQNLTVLYLSSAPEGIDLKPLEKLQSLSSLDLRNAPQGIDLKPLEKLQSLSELWFDTYYSDERLKKFIASL